MNSQISSTERQPSLNLTSITATTEPISEHLTEHMSTGNPSFLESTSANSTENPNAWAIPVLTGVPVETLNGGESVQQVLPASPNVVYLNISSPIHSMSTAVVPSLVQLLSGKALVLFYKARKLRILILIHFIARLVMLFPWTWWTNALWIISPIIGFIATKSLSVRKIRLYLVICLLDLVYTILYVVTTPSGAFRTLKIVDAAFSLLILYFTAIFLIALSKLSEAEIDNLRLL